MRRGPFDPPDPFRHRPQQRPEPARSAPEPLVPAPRRPADDAPRDAADLRAENRRLRSELKAVSERYVELQQDLERMRARNLDAVARARQEAREGVLDTVFEVVDALDRAVAGASERDSAWFDGIVQLRRGALAALERRGVTRFGFRGEPFDPDQHEALATVRDPELPAGYVASVEVAGYRDQDGALLRPARVVVAA